ncbi:MAG: MFS transporter, partial [Chloroflexota bacterium]
MSEKPKNEVGKINETGWWVLFATISASSMAFIGGSSLNVALPAIQSDLGASGGDLLWIINAYALFLAALLLLGGSLGDHYGRKRIYMVGIVIFTLASVACGLAPTSEVLIGARIVQGIGGAMMVPGSLAIVSAYFDDNTRGKAIGYWSSVTTLTSVAGPLLGGVLAENGLWRGIFYINIPLAIVALYALVTRVPESYDEEATSHFDYVGAILVALGMAGITYGSITIGEVGIAGFQRVDLLGSLIGGLVLLGAFIWWEGRSREPMMPLRLFESSTFLGANLLTLLLYGALGGALYFLPLNLVQVQGYGETLAGIAFLPWSILLVVLSPVMGNLVDRYGARLPLTIGPIVTGFGFGALALIGMTDGPSDYWLTYLPATLILGAGMGILVAPLTTAVMGSVPQNSAGIASGVNNAMSRASQVLALSIMGGIGLVVFTSAFAPEIEALSLPETETVTLIDASADLAGINIPETLSEGEQEEVQDVIDRQFVSMFNLVMWIAAGMC